jgi:hypothetical protein
MPNRTSVGIDAVVLNENRGRFSIQAFTNGNRASRYEPSTRLDQVQALYFPHTRSKHSLALQFVHGYVPLGSLDVHTVVITLAFPAKLVLDAAGCCWAEIHSLKWECAIFSFLRATVQCSAGPLILEHIRVTN